MPDTCAAWRCPNVRSIQSRARGITFHKFPKGREQRRQWEIAVRRKGFSASRRSVLCSDHFRPEALDRTGQTVRVRDKAKPSVFSFPPHLQRPVVTRTTRTSQKAAERLCVERPLHGQQTDPLPEDHAYALPASPTNQKARLCAALARVEGLEREVRNAEERERRAKNVLHGLLELLRGKNLATAELEEMLRSNSADQSGEPGLEVSQSEAEKEELRTLLVAAETELWGGQQGRRRREELRRGQQGRGGREELQRGQQGRRRREELQRGQQGRGGREGTAENSSGGDNVNISDLENQTLTVIGVEGLELLHLVSDEGLCPEVRGQDRPPPDQQAGAPGGPGDAPPQPRRPSRPQGARPPRKETEPQLSSRRRRGRVRLQAQAHAHAAAAERPLVCQQCGRSFASRRRLDSHSLLHTGEQRPLHASDLRPFLCAACGKTFSHARGLRTHQTVHSGARPYGCDLCGKRFGFQGNLRRHQRIHSADRPFRCDQCGRGFNAERALKAHLRSRHAEGRSHTTCALCGKAFGSAGYLSTHLSTVHAGARPFSCPLCAKTFTQRSSLNTHRVTVHSAARPYGCDLCGRGFNNAGNLRRHRRVHTGERPYGCDLCGRSFNQGNSLKAHRLIHARGHAPSAVTHPEDTPPQL